MSASGRVIYFRTKRETQKGTKTKGGERHVLANIARISIEGVVDMSFIPLLRECVFFTVQKRNGEIMHI